MISKKVLDQIIFLSEEEKNNLKGKNEIDKSIFLSDNSSVVDYHKLLNEKDQISIRKHARFMNIQSILPFQFILRILIFCIYT